MPLLPLAFLGNDDFNHHLIMHTVFYITDLKNFSLKHRARVFASSRSDYLFSQTDTFKMNTNTEF